MSDTYLIFWDIVEEHIPSRVMRQFHCFQPIPANPQISQEMHTAMHGSSRKGNRDCDWADVCKSFIQKWDSRHQNINNTTHVDSLLPTIDYRRWYAEITVIHISPPQQQEIRGYQNRGDSWELMVCNIL